MVKNQFLEDPITQQINDTYEDPNIQIPMLLNGYRIPSMKERDYRVLDMISSVLSLGKSSRLYKRLVDKDKLALEAGAFNLGEEDYSAYVIYALPMTGKKIPEIQAVIDEEIAKIRTELISEKEYQKLLNQFENAYVSTNSTSEGVASNLAEYYLLYGDVNLINTEIDIYRSITREEIRDVANKYLQPNQRLVLDYLPKK